MLLFRRVFFPKVGLPQGLFGPGNPIGCRPGPTSPDGNRLCRVFRGGAGRGPFAGKIARPHVHIAVVAEDNSSLTPTAKAVLGNRKCIGNLAKARAFLFIETELDICELEVRPTTGAFLYH